MRLSAPSTLVFVISLVIAIVGLLVGTGMVVGISIASFWILAVAYVVLAAGCLMRGL
ncbi:hypothetical protein DFR52_102924 [Hoeflea marina]|uniref:Uncharacterized protein n=1 Tax=Hoeflea marina TaxID=274592 RepID=A0A317PNB3_9HYPH|nr:hypothetical protein [Hoeflea marina]PWW02256.1 hypothetical protein DFR52_102924 [Hoeflea marina]